jgi:phosphoenolpyruvate synthase/pyruvate phosphate dikinase
VSSYVLGFEAIGQIQIESVGGKAANLGKLSRIEGILVPTGFCVTADAFHRVTTSTPMIDERLGHLARVDPDDLELVRAISAEIRDAYARATIPDDVVAAIDAALAQFEESQAFAVRSSATAEDLPTASFAGLYDTYLNVSGASEILQHIGRCWGSLFTERAIVYRLRNGIDPRAVQMAVVIQQMVTPDASGVVFTADPVTSDRMVTFVEATFGLGEGLVSGRITPDAFQVRESQVISKAVSSKRLAVVSSAAGGTVEVPIDVEHQNVAALDDTQVLQLAQIGQQIAAHFGRPQDIEWCLVAGDFHIVQSRPITTLFPIPVTDDGANHVFVSVGHGQMMTDAMKPLGISMWQLTALPRMYAAGGRLFVDVTQRLASPASRANLLDVMGKSDPVMRDALETVLDREDFIPAFPDEEPAVAPAGSVPDPIQADPAVVTELMANAQASIGALQRDIASRSGPGLVEFILSDIQELKRILFDPNSYRVFMSAMEATWWINERLETWLGEKNAADVLTQSVANNVTSEMGLALLGVADVIRPHPEVITFLEHVENDEGLLEEMAKRPGGREASRALQAFLDKYGMRCVGEIDITRPRWAECPTSLVPMILGNIKNFESGAGKQMFEQGLEKAAKKEERLLEQLQTLPDGAQKAAEVKRMIDLVRTFIGYREYPKYGMVSRYFIYKQALLDEARRLVAGQVLRSPDDIYYLTFAEFGEVVRTHQADNQLIGRRRAEYASYQSLSAPRVLTSDGESIAGAYRRDGVPPGALVGLAVSAGVVEGRARVISDVAEADLEAGDILVTAYTDPSWTPTFVAIAGLVTEVGGLMTHGAVIAREYGLPAVVGVQNVQRLIRNGQRIRVDGGNGFVEILS